MKNKEQINETILNSRQQDDISDEKITTGSYSSYEMMRNLQVFKGDNKGRGRLNYMQEYAKNISINVVNSNFQSMSVNLHYGNFGLLCHIIFVRLSHNFMRSLDKIGKGSFGCVYGLKIDGGDYVIKVVEVEGRKSIEVSKQLYKEYFLACLADQLGAGPRMGSIFGYDLLVTESEVIFSMERCFPTNLQKNENAYKELCQSLSLMHSVGFIHSDIKPANIAFSEKCEKHIFLDFGISSLRPQKMGEKSLVGFMGTLKYCSQEMKKCYILRKRMYVDLYENDWCCLKKAVEQPKVGRQLMKGEINNYNGLGMNEGLIRRFCMLLNLKNEIFQVNIGRVVEYLEMCVDMPICCCQVLQGKNVNREILCDIRVMNLLRQAKIRKNDIGRLNQIDKQLGICFNEQNLENICLQYFPVGVILKMEGRKFMEVVMMDYWVVKMFVFLDPFEAQKVKEIGCDRWVDRKCLVQKIFSVFASKQEIMLTDRFPGLMSIKTEFTLRFFYGRMKKMKNVKLLHSLRLLFIATMSKLDYILIKQIECQILLLTEDRDELMLRLISFILFWRRHNNGFDFQYREIDGWFQKVRDEEGFLGDDFSRRVFELLKLIRGCEELDDLPEEARVMIEGIMKENQKQKYRYFIQNIRYLILLMVYNKMDYSKDGLEWKILVYHQNVNLEVNFNGSNFERCFLGIFRRLGLELFKQIYAYFAGIVNN